MRTRKLGIAGTNTELGFDKSGLGLDRAQESGKLMGMCKLQKSECTHQLTGFNV